MDYSTHFGTQLAAFGWPMLGGVHNSPDLELFRFLAPESPGLTEEVYNRYNHYSFELPPATSRIITPDSIRVAIDPCSRRVAALGVNHLLMKADAVPPPACALEWTSQPAGEFRLWSRRTPVCVIGVAPAGAQGALDFDYSCPSEARLVAGRAGFALEVPPDPARSWAVAINPSAAGSVECTHASARWAGAHLIVRPETGGAASCRGRYLDSAAALRRLMKR